MINLSKITERQKLTIAKGLLDYCYIMNNWMKNDPDFQDVYYNFYLKARWSVMSKPENKDPYFAKLQTINPNGSLIKILDDLKKDMGSHSYEFSLVSKLLHTRNPQKPIYDSKVRDYLTIEEGVDLWTSKSPKGTTVRDKIVHDWDELNKWYDDFINKNPRGKQRIDWFDINFPSYKSISNVKKIDFIIFATR